MGGTTINILFIHRNFPAQFRHIAPILAQDKENNVVFLTNNIQAKSYGGIKKVIYNLKRKVPKDCHGYLKFYEDAIIHGQGAAEAMITLKNSGFEPDVIVGHSWGSSLFAKEIFPNAKYIAYIEWYYNYENSDFDFLDKNLNVDDKAKLICKNSHILLDLTRCDIGITPTQWQKSQIPEIFSNKIKVIHEGIDTGICKPDDNVVFNIPNSDLKLTRNDKVLTYATRGMEEYRGFPEFMHAASILMKKIPDLHVVVGGEDRVCYGRKIANSTFKTEMLKKYDYDMNRLHFVGLLPYIEHVKLLQVSSVHVYLTYPFVLSWSLLEAMAAGCIIVASDTQPVREMINESNGILVGFNDINAIVEKVTDVINNRNKYKELPKNSRKFVQDNFEQSDKINEQLSLIKSIMD